uniref:Protein ENHANCED DISEASE RESISTANCE 2 C-terminal domain-containing protein n=1 Tax=Craspedostauros australis TaxID=1486917 RepID=A0A7R9ZJE0_9STRA|mmetsp:Transcript_10472/g.28832  ORF Transcript_10472/g.28832 Transcript_10472/m.28832 type:complete len:303 (+) Transcript_10472:54-962(+)
MLPDAAVCGRPRASWGCSFVRCCVRVCVLSFRLERSTNCHLIPPTFLCDMWYGIAQFMPHHVMPHNVMLHFVPPVRRWSTTCLAQILIKQSHSNRGVFGGNLREKPTFIINFRLPWGVLLAYFEIPERFIPFIKACYDPAFDKSSLPSLKGMSPSDRCVARYLQASDKKKDQVLKIVPIVVEGPWIVKTTVGGKPAILGTKLPVTYIYQPAEKGKALYLEADLDIVSSSAARGILSVARAYTQVLTLDLGFVVQGNTDDELPEQMLVGTRLHGIDPISAPPFPPSKDVFFRSADITDSEESL